MCEDLGRNNYLYQPHITTEVLPDGTKIPKVCCKAFPDKTKEFHNVLSFDEIEDKSYMIKEKWENFMYDEDRGENSPELQIDETEGYIFGL
jgi:hypothetical protein